MATVHIIGWPRWMRDRVPEHPGCTAFGIEHTALRPDAVPEACTVVRMEDHASEAEFRKALTALEDDDVTQLMLSEGVDSDGVVHSEEIVMFTGRPNDTTTPPPVSFPVVATPPACKQRRAPSAASSEPSWLVDAGGRHRKEDGESRGNSFGGRGGLPLHTAHDVHSLKDTQECVLTLEGVHPRATSGPSRNPISPCTFR